MTETAVFDCYCCDPIQYPHSFFPNQSTLFSSLLPPGWWVVNARRKEIAGVTSQWNVSCPSRLSASPPRPLFSKQTNCMYLLKYQRRLYVPPHDSFYLSAWKKKRVNIKRRDLNLDEGRQMRCLTQPHHIPHSSPPCNHHVVSSPLCDQRASHPVDMPFQKALPTIGVKAVSEGREKTIRRIELVLESRPPRKGEKKGTINPPSSSPNPLSIHSNSKKVVMPNDVIRERGRSVYHNWDAWATDFRIVVAGGTHP